MAAPEAVRIQVPTLSGEVTLKTRSMFRKRAGRPRSLIRSGGPAATPPNATNVAVRASARFPARRAPRARVADAPARPPAKR
jgi:hypothetical protein